MKRFLTGIAGVVCLLLVFHVLNKELYTGDIGLRALTSATPVTARQMMEHKPSGYVPLEPAAIDTKEKRTHYVPLEPSIGNALGVSEPSFSDNLSNWFIVIFAVMFMYVYIKLVDWGVTLYVYHKNLERQRTSGETKEDSHE